MGMIGTGEVRVQGTVAPGFEAVADEFRRNFAERGEVGAAVAACRDGQPVVDLWGGSRDARRVAPWREDTLVAVFSTTKGVAALAVAVAQSRGLFDYEDTVCTYWPEFARHGKGQITIRQLMSFQGGLCYLDGKIDVGTVADPDRLADRLARQKPAWRPGDYHGYHLFTADWCASELIRRTDPAGRTLGRFLRDEVATPLGAEFYIGAPADIPEERFAAIHEFRLSQLFAHLDTMPWGTVLGLALPGSLARRTMLNLEVRTPAQMALPPYRSLELPGANGVGQVRGLARMYAAFATGGTSLGLRTTTLEALEQAACPPRRGIRDRVLKTDMVYSLGFIKPFPGFPFAPSGRAFGAAGTGGSFAFADPDARLGYAYAPNRLGFHQFNDPREVALRGALYRCLEQA